MGFFAEIPQMFNLWYFGILIGFHMAYHLVSFMHMTIKNDRIDEVETPYHVRTSVQHFLRTYAIIKSEAQTWIPIAYCTCFLARWLVFTEGSWFFDLMAFILTVVSATINMYYEVNLDLDNAVDPLSQWVYIIFHCFNFNYFGPLGFWGARFTWSIIIR